MNRTELLKIAKPILFNTEMVQAILADRKTQTRRPVKVKAPYSQKQLNERINYRSENDVKKAALNGKISRVGFWTPYDGYVPHKPCRYQVGDYLYVRETFGCVRTGNGKSVPYETDYWYRADEKDYNPDNKWTPSIHMPKEAARIFLKVTDVKVERLNEITENDSKKEGVIVDKPSGYERKDYIFAFEQLWNTMYDDYPSSDNPWVFVYEFERVVVE